MNLTSNRRQFLSTSVALGAGYALARGSTIAAQGLSSDGASASETVQFFAIGDTHYFANEKSTKELMDS
ncbi:MAG: hypothetical protein ACKO9Q_22075 [Pirellula sp.]